jgi:hypothetical protein
MAGVPENKSKKQLTELETAFAKVGIEEDQWDTDDSPIDDNYAPLMAKGEIKRANLLQLLPGEPLPPEPTFAFSLAVIGDKLEVWFEEEEAKEATSRRVSPMGDWLAVHAALAKLREEHLEQ